MLPMKTGLPAKALRLVPYLTPEESRRPCGGCQGRERDASYRPGLDSVDSAALLD